MVITMKELYVDGVKLPTPRVDGVVHTSNKIWSKNTGRLESTGDMIGTIVAIKQKLEITWPDLSVSDANGILAAVDNSTEFHTLTYVDVSGTAHTLAVYFGDPSYTLRYNALGRGSISGLKVSAIEK